MRVKWLFETQRTGISDGVVRFLTLVETTVWKLVDKTNTHTLKTLAPKTHLSRFSMPFHLLFFSCRDQHKGHKCRSHTERTRHGTPIFTLHNRKTIDTQTLTVTSVRVVVVGLEHPLHSGHCVVVCVCTPRWWSITAATTTTINVSVVSVWSYSPPSFLSFNRVIW